MSWQVERAMPAPGGDEPPGLVRILLGYGAAMTLIAVLFGGAAYWLIRAAEMADPEIAEEKPPGQPNEPPAKNAGNDAAPGPRALDAKLTGSGARRRAN
jgi:hypothetical protein